MCLLLCRRRFIGVPAEALGDERVAGGGVDHELADPVGAGAELPALPEDYSPRRQAPEHIHQRPGGAEAGGFRDQQGDGAYAGPGGDAGGDALLPFVRGWTRRPEACKN